MSNTPLSFCKLEVIYLSLVSSYCDLKSLGALAGINQGVSSKMEMIWKARLNQENLFFLYSAGSNCENSWIENLMHFTGVVFMDYQQADKPTVSCFRNPESYNSPAIRQIMDSQNMQDRMGERPQGYMEKMVWMQSCFQQAKAKKILRPLWFEQGVCMQKMMDAIKYDQLEFFEFLEMERRKPLTETGYKEITDNCRKIIIDANTTRLIQTPICQSYGVTYHRITMLLLAYAAKCGNLRIANMLLEKCHGININANVHEGCEGRLKQPEKLVNPDWTCTDKSLLQSVLMYATYYGNQSVVRSFIAAKADVNAQQLGYEGSDDSFCTPLMCAISRRNKGMVHELLLAKANVNMGGRVSTFGIEAAQTPLSTAIGEREIEITEMLLKAKADPNAIAKMVRKVKEVSNGMATNNGFPLVEKGIPINATPLILALHKKTESGAAHEEGYKKDIHLVKLLLIENANPNYCVSRGKALCGMSPLEFAAGAGNLPVISTLLEAKADPSVALLIAARMKQLGAVQVLLHAKANPDFILNNETPLIAAILEAERPYFPYYPLPIFTTPHPSSVASQTQSERAEIVAQLLQANANPNLKIGGRTALMHAAAWRQVNCVSVLLANRADCNLVDSKRQTALFSVIKSRKGVNSDIYPIVQALISCGASVNDTDAEGNTLLSLIESARLNRKQLYAVIPLLTGEESKTPPPVEGAVSDDTADVEEINAPSSRKKRKTAKDSTKQKRKR